MTIKHLFTAFLCLLVLFVAACGPLVFGQSGEKCDLGSYPPRCTDGVLFECNPGSDCIHHDCSGLGCECFDYAHIERTDCSNFGERCVVDKDRAFCQ